MLGEEGLSGQFKHPALLGRLSRVALRMPNGVALVRARGEIEWANRSFRLLVGKPGREVRNRLLDDFFVNQSATDASPSSRCSLTQRVLQGRFLETSVVLKVPPPGNSSLYLYCSPLIDSDGRGDGCICVVVPATEMSPRDETLRNFQLILNQVHDAVLVCDEHSLAIVYANSGATKQLGFSTSEFGQLRLFDLLPEFGETGFREYVAPLLSRQEEMLRTETLYRRANGGMIPVNVLFQYVKTGSEAGQLIAVAKDISRRKEAEKQRGIAASVFENSNEAILITDGDNRVIDANPAFTRITGYAREEVIGVPASLLGPDRHPDPLYREIWATVQAQGFWRGEVCSRRKNGEVYPELLSITRVQSAESQAFHHVAIFTDISHLKAHEQALRIAAQYDDLTGLPNRRALIDRLDQAIARSRRDGKSVAVCFVDLDGFKSVNDRFGHRAGDRALKAMAEALKGCVRAQDTVARLGGDEFVVLLIDADDPAIYDRIIEKAAAPIAIGRAQVSLSASMGVTVFPVDDNGSEGLLRHADMAMYTAKLEGKNRYQFFDPKVDAERKRQRDFLRELGEAMENKELRLWFQPQVDLSTMSVVGLEALIRWQHPARGLLAAAEFLPAVSGTGFELRLGDWVLTEALQAARFWWDRGYQIPLCVNVSPRQLLHRDFVSGLSRCLESQQVARPSMLLLEVVEAAAMDDLQRACRIMTQCRRLGPRFALDDFGVGCASVSHLKNLPIDQVKLGQSLVANMLADPGDLAIVESGIFLAQRFRKAVVAEGVETLEHARTLAQKGCGWGQGFGIARPMPLEETLDWLGEHAFSSRSKG